MTNFKLTVQYDGGRYNGWQRLGSTGNTIQGKIERVLTEMAGHAVEIHGAGRTDAGVHAAAQTASAHARGNPRIFEPLFAAGHRRVGLRNRPRAVPCAAQRQKQTLHLPSMVFRHSKCI